MSETTIMWAGFTNLFGAMLIVTASKMASGCEAKVEPER